VEFGEDFQAHQMGLIDEKQGDLLLGGDVAEGVANDGQETGDGVGHGGSAETEQGGPRTQVKLRSSP